MSLDNLEDSMKIIVVGDGNVGKTTMLRRYVKGVYSEQYKKTIGADYMEKEIYLKDLKQNVTMMLWDTAGQEVFNALTSTYYRNAAACVLAFSTIDRDSFMSVANWKKKVEAQCGPIVMILCQTKFDLVRDAAMTPAEADQLASHLNLPFFRISTKENENVSQLFEFVAKQVVLRGGSGDDGADCIHPTSSNNNNNTNSNANASSSGPNASTATNANAASTSSAAATPAASASSPVEEKDDKKKDKKDKKDKKNKGGDEDSGKDAHGNSTKPIQMKELQKKDKKKKKGGCIV